jgi:hypothetical protein
MLTSRHKDAVGSGQFNSETYQRKSPGGVMATHFNQIKTKTTN